MNQILAAVPGSLFPVVATLAFMGARSGEIQRLLMADVDFKGGWLHVVSREGGETTALQLIRIGVFSARFA